MTVVIVAMYVVWLIVLLPVLVLLPVVVLLPVLVLLTLLVVWLLVEVRLAVVEAVALHKELKIQPMKLMTTSVQMLHPVASPSIVH